MKVKVLNTGLYSPAKLSEDDVYIIKDTVFEVLEIGYDTDFAQYRVQTRTGKMVHLYGDQVTVLKDEELK